MLKLSFSFGRGGAFSFYDWEGFCLQEREAVAQENWHKQIE
jgi:hypothetical protein